MNYQDFYNKFEEKYKNNFYLAFRPCEEQRLKTLHDYRIKTFLFFILIPLIICSIYAGVYMYSIGLLIALAVFINIFLLIYYGYYLVHNTNIIYLLLILPAVFKVQGLAILYVVIVPLIVYRELFLKHREKWNKKYK